MRFMLRPPEKRPPGAVAVSVAMHIVFGALLLRAVVGSNGIAEWLIGPAGTAVTEKVVAVAVFPPRGVQGGGAPVDRRSAPAVRAASGAVVAPRSVPTSIPAPAGGLGGTGGGTGTGIGTGSGSGVARGLTPGYDPRLYPGPAQPAPIPRTPKERLDSVIAERFAEYADSAANAPQSSVTEDGRGDLTFKRGGRTYGWTQRGIVLGKFTLPAPLLALLPLNRIGGNPSSLLRQENPWQMRNQIQAGAQVALNAETFNERVKRIRERRDRERRDARENQGREPPVPVTPVPMQPQQP